MSRKKNKKKDNKVNSTSQNNNVSDIIMEISFAEHNNLRIEYNKIYSENMQLKAQLHMRNEDYEKQLNQKNIKIDHLEKEIERLEKENKELKERIILLETDIKQLKDDQLKFKALVKLHECNTIVNNIFKKEYRQHFNRKKYDKNIPNIGDFIESPPDEIDDKDDYKFWSYFCKKYPKSDDIQFRKLYKYINNERTKYGAHCDVNNMTKQEFDISAKIVFNDYDNNKILYDTYRDWIYLFPTEI